MRRIHTTQDDMATFNERLARYYAGESATAPPADSKDDGNVRRAGTWSAGTTKTLQRSSEVYVSPSIAKSEKESRGFLERSWIKLFKFKKEKHVGLSANAGAGDITAVIATSYCLTEASPVWYSQFASTPYHAAAGQLMMPSSSIATASA